MSRILAIDLGEKRIGIAISDPTQTIASPLKTIQFGGFRKLVIEIQLIIGSHNIMKIIVGFPITMKGTMSKQTENVMNVYEKLKKTLSVEIQLYDERLTTVQAKETLKLLKKKASKERNRIDQIAASHLLQNFLDREINIRQT